MLVRFIPVAPSDRLVINFTSVALDGSVFVQKLKPTAIKNLYLHTASSIDRATVPFLVHEVRKKNIEIDIGVNSNKAEIFLFPSEFF